MRQILRSNLSLSESDRLRWCSGFVRGGFAARGGDVGELWPQRVGHLAPGYAVLPNLRLQPSNVNLDYDPV